LISGSGPLKDIVSMLVIPLAFYLVILELAVGSFVTLYALDVRNDSSINFVRFQAWLYLLLFTLLAWATLRGFTTATQLRADSFHFDFPWLARQEPALLWFMLAQLVYAIVSLIQGARIARLIAGGIALALGLFTLFSVAMGLRVISDARLGGAPTVAGFLMGALSLGGVSTAMLLGHWYLNTPKASGKPLEFATGLTIIGLVAEMILFLLAGPVTYSTHGGTALASLVTAGSTTPVSPVPHGVTFPTPALIVIGIVLGLGAVGLTALALRLERERSFQSATGMLYLAVVLTFFAEILGRALFLRPLL
jgi:hypothetical protein